MTGFETWIGVQRTAADVVTERLVSAFRTTLEGTLCPEPHLPGIQWCLAPDMLPPAELGRDGHPRTGLLLPDMGLPRRMWAGGSVAYHQGGIAPGNAVERVSTIRDVQYKTGRSGKLGFVKVEHLYKVGGRVRVSEEQDIVYRDHPTDGASPKEAPAAEQWKPVRSVEITPDATLLFRYSAMTFNGHRIHYDFPYATEAEGYPGLVVHGPMQATWMQHLATTVLGRLPARFAYRGSTPLICGRRAAVEARSDASGLKLRVRDLAANSTTMEATAE